MTQKKLYIAHGWAYDTKKWKPFLDALGALGLEASLINLPGLTAPIKKPWDLDDYVSHVSEKLPAEGVHFLGHSFGGQIGVRLAAQYPKKLASLILIDAAGIRDMSFKMRTKRFIFRSLAKVGKKIAPFPGLRPLLYRLARERDYNQASALMKQTMKKVIATEVKTDALKVEKPTLIIWGENDRVTPMWMGREYARLIQNSRMQIIEQGRHSPHFQYPEKVAEMVSEFLEKVK